MSPDNLPPPLSSLDDLDALLAEMDAGTASCVASVKDLKRCAKDLTDVKKLQEKESKKKEPPSSSSDRWADPVPMDGGEGGGRQQKKTRDPFAVYNGLLENAYV